MSAYTEIYFYQAVAIALDDPQLLKFYKIAIAIFKVSQKSTISTHTVTLA
ncbi:MAG: hypothetical protein AB1861_00275 [Cyanobacteriota bacterium]